MCFIDRPQKLPLFAPVSRRCRVTLHNVLHHSFLAHLHCSTPPAPATFLAHLPLTFGAPPTDLEHLFGSTPTHPAASAPSLRCRTLPRSLLPPGAINAKTRRVVCVCCRTAPSAPTRHRRVSATLIHDHPPSPAFSLLSLVDYRTRSSHANPVCLARFPRSSIRPYPDAPPRLLSLRRPPSPSSTTALLLLPFFSLVKNLQYGPLPLSAQATPSAVRLASLSPASSVRPDPRRLPFPFYHLPCRRFSPSSSPSGLVLFAPIACPFRKYNLIPNLCRRSVLLTQSFLSPP
ncbi:hypothetical protein DFH07DRAFT_1016635 [Mycena maculata]|uniref:Uncharacterized protein n=1 Tax=Mycena maculata TaxID=230809 RepID=A0AAD7JG31_9AGAR|nr:hypothetical protein DFH07DRAFT_1016635 [Mycena maculata]